MKIDKIVKLNFMLDYPDELFYTSKHEQALISQTSPDPFYVGRGFIDAVYISCRRCEYQYGHQAIG